MKKLLTVTLLALLVTVLLTFSACGNESTTTATTTSSTPSGTGTVSDTSTTRGGTETTEPDNSFNEAEHVAQTDDSVTVTSLNQKLVMKISKNASNLPVYTLSTQDGTEIIGESELGMVLSGLTSFQDVQFTAANAKRLTSTYSFLGNFSTLTDDCVAATVGLKKDDYEFSIEIKLYDNGVAFRYNLPGDSRRTVSGESTSFKVNDIKKVWYGQNADNYESEIVSARYAGISTSNKLTGPLMIELNDDKGYVSLLEGYVNDTYIGTNFVSTGSDNTFKVSGSWSSSNFDAFIATGDVVTGWRIINYSQDLGDVAINNNVYHSALGMTGDASAYEDTDWITPGKSVWSWINDRGVPFEPQINYTLNAAKLGFTYNIIDEGYYNWEEYESKLKELGNLGEQNNVKQILWCYVSPSHIGYRITSPDQAKALMQTLTELNMSGIKLDFFDSETKQITHQIQKAILDEGMKSEIIVDFHGVHKPVAFSVLYPNELTREGIRGLENMDRNDIVKQAQFFTTQFYTRMLSGHADFTPDVNTAMQIASLIVVDSPLTVVATNPLDIMANPALEMIRAIPTVWDKTVFLDGKVGSSVSLAKEHDGVWYVGGVYATNTRDVKVSLSEFLGEGEYLLTGWKDTSTTAKTSFTQKVTRDSVIDIGNMPAGCGYVMQITKLALNQYGGEINKPIQIVTASSDAVVKYTLDGSDPATSTTAATYNGSITLTDSCLLRVAITDGDGAGTSLSYQFNKIEYIDIQSEMTHEDGKTTLKLSSDTNGVKIYYTTDGSTPTASSTLYTAPITLTQNTAVNAIAVSESGKTSMVSKITVTVTKAITTVTPDVYIGGNYKEVKDGWGGLVGINKSMNNTTLSLGGASADSGTKFAHGISTNAVGYFVYDIPANATEFVGVVGIDDSTYLNAGDGSKASIICTVYVDGTALFTSQKLGQGQYESIRITLPENAKEIKIHFGDAGDGITCDNATLAEGGFLLAK